MKHPQLYGIKNCDSVKKARTWLADNGIDYHFHDLRADGLSRELVARWLDHVGMEILVNKRSTTWKQLSPNDQQHVLEGGAVDVLLANPTLIKRPVLVHNDETIVGFKAATYAAKIQAD